MDCAWSGTRRVATDEVVEGALRVEHQGPQLPRPRPVDPLGRVGERLEAEGVGEPLGRVDRDDARPATGPGPFDGERGRGGRLPDAARAARDQDRPAGDERPQVAGVRGVPRARHHGSFRTAAPSASASRSSSGRPRRSVNRNGSDNWGRGSASAQPRDLLRLQVEALTTELGRLAAARPPRPRRSRRLPRGGIGGVDVEARHVRVHAVDDDGAECDADPVLERVGGVDQLVDRGLLGQGDEDDLAAAGVAEQVDDLLRLSCGWGPSGRRRADRGRSRGT